VIAGVEYFELPTAHEIGEHDAIAAMQTLAATGFPGDVSVWSGNPLYLGLGDASFWQSSMLEVQGDTYDLAACIESLLLAGINSISEMTDLIALFAGQGQEGVSQAAQVISASLADTSDFFQETYGNVTAGLSDLATAQVLAGKDGDDFSIGEELGFSPNTFINAGKGNDLIIGSRGQGTLDGGSGADDVSFETLSHEDGQTGLTASIFHINSKAQFSASVSGHQINSALFNVEELSLGRHDDTLKIYDLI
jgi:hypothetical protein